MNWSMRRLGGTAAVGALLSFNGGFVDAIGFFGLQGLFIAHVTGNFVTLGAALVHGSHEVIGKLLALPEFVVVVALARLAGAALRARQWPAKPIMLGAKVVALAAFLGCAVAYGPFPDANSAGALLTGFSGVAAMALQNAVQRVHFASLPPTTVMTSSTVQVTLDAIDLLTGIEPTQIAAVRARFRRLSLNIVSFAVGCTVAALLYTVMGFWCLAVAVIVGAAAAVLGMDGAPP